MNYVKLPNGNKYKYMLLEPCFDDVILTGYSIFTEYISLNPNGIMTLAKDYAWDGPSGPTFDTKSFMRGSLFHDAFYQLMDGNHLNIECRKHADMILRRMCLEDGMNWFRAWYVYRAVRLFGGYAIG
ncbi:MAG: hypothetical protein PVI43_01530 [Candidatus Bathyarchaeota archaeon]|jgi:hypothetical protein